MPGASSKGCRLLLGVAIVLSCIGCDQATKRIATRALQDAPVKSYFADTIRLQYALNPGGFLSLGASLPSSLRQGLFIGINAVFMLLIGCALIIKWNGRLAVFASLAYVLAGGIANLIDRMTQNGLVTDFINVGIGPLRSGIFNVADVAVVFGTMALILCTRSRSESR